MRTLVPRGIRQAEYKVVQMQMDKKRQRIQ